jgi:hypothetical protein
MLYFKAAKYGLLALGAFVASNAVGIDLVSWSAELLGFTGIGPF